MTSLVDGQYEWVNEQGESILLGAETPVRVVTTQGLLGWAIGTVADQVRARRHGAFYGGPDYTGPRTIQMAITIEQVLETDCETMLDTLHSIFKPGDIGTSGFLRMKRRSKSQRMCVCRARNSAFDANYDNWVGTITGAIEFFAADPRVYDDLVLVQELISDDFSTGKTYPLLYPVTYNWTGASDGKANCHNDGNFESPPQVQFVGPGKNFVLANTTTGKSIAANIELAAGDVLTLDFDSQDVTLNETVDRRGCIGGDPDWWSLHKGDNQVFFRAVKTAADVPRCIISWRSAWISG